MAAANVQGVQQWAKTMWGRYRALLIVLTLTLLGAGLRLHGLDANGISNDEAYTIWVAQHDTRFILQLATFKGWDANNPPVHYLLSRALLQIAGNPLVLRLLSALAGTLTVPLTFGLAMSLFDLRVATLSTFLIAVAPLHVAHSQVGRAHMLAAVFGLVSLYAFARLLFQKSHRRHWMALVAATATAVWTFHTMSLLVLFENSCILFLWLRGRISRSMLVRWFISQSVVGIVVLPAVVTALMQSASHKIGWIPRPGVQSLVKSAILYGTGDPSYGPTGVTLPRILSLMTILAVCVLGLRTFLRRGYHRGLDEEGLRVMFLAGAFALPLGAAFLVSQVRSIWRERYFLFVMPPLFILFAWIVVRAKYKSARWVTLFALVAMTGWALSVYYTEPFGEQWREAIADMRPAYRSEDLVVIAPGHYCIPFAYYFSGAFPEDAQALEQAPAVLLEDGDYRGLSFVNEAGNVWVDDPALATGRRIWFASGYAPVDPLVSTWIEEGLEPLDQGEFLGARVCLLQRTQSPGTPATGVPE